MVLEESRFVCGYVLTFFGDWLVHASDVNPPPRRIFPRVSQLKIALTGESLPPK